MNPIVEEAIRFASLRHQGQVRKGSNIPYITHPYAVGMLLEADHQSPSVVAAGLLHDVVEDTDTTLEEIRQRFGPDVTRLVTAVTEPDKGASWESRKRTTIERIQSLQYDEVALLVADKLHNIRSIQHDLMTDGLAVWERFNRPLRDQSWYYHELLRALQPFKETTDLIGLYESELETMFFGEVGAKEQKMTKLIESLWNGFIEEEWLQEVDSLCQTAFELHRLVTRDPSEQNGALYSRSFLIDTNSLQELPVSLLQGLKELSYRFSIRPEEMAVYMRNFIVK